MGLIFIICGLACALFRTPQATTASVIISTLIGKVPKFSPVREFPVRGFLVRGFVKQS